MTHDGSNQVNIVNSVIDDSISPTLDENEGLSAKDREDISRLYLEFVNLCGNVEDVMKAWNRHVRLFPRFLRMSNSNKSSISSRVLSDAAKDRDGSYHLTVTDQTLNSTPLLHKEIRVQGNLLTQDTDNINAKEMVVPKLSSGKALALSNGDTFEDKAPRLPIQSREQVIVGKYPREDNALVSHGSDQVLHDHPREDKTRPMDSDAQLSDQSLRSSAQQVDKSSKPPNADGKALSDSINVQPELKKQKLQVSLDHIPLRSQENRSHDLISMPCGEPETKRDLPVPCENNPHGELRRDESVGNLGNSTNVPDPKMPPTASEVPITKDDRVPNSCSQIQTHTKDQKQLMSDGSNDKTITSDKEQPLSATPTSTTRPPSASPQVSSYPQENTKEDASQQNQHQWPHQNPAMNPMLQYQYNHQQLMQQYQQQQHQIYMSQHPYQQGQQIYMQYPYDQHYMNQQPYQIQSQQQNPYNFQGQQLNSMPYQVQQLMTSYQQGQGTQPYQAYQMGYQIPELGQQCANYQGMNNHTQPHEGSVLVQDQHVGPGQRQRDEQTEKSNLQEGPKLPH